MKRCSAAAIALAFLMSAANAEPLRLRVMTYNIKNGSGTTSNTWADRRPILKNLIEREDPDLIGTQEGFYYQMKHMAEDMPQYEWIGLGRAGGSKDEFMGIFYKGDRFDLIAYDHFWLSDTPEIIGSRTWGHNNRRMVTWARFKERESGREFYHWNTHFDHRVQEAREKSAGLVLRRILALDTKLPVILTGDFNAAQDNAVHEILTARGDGAFYLRDSWKIAKEIRGNQVATGHGWRGISDGTRQIDWILVSPEFTSQTIEVITYKEGGQWPSDHFPVVADLLLAD